MQFVPFQGVLVFDFRHVVAQRLYDREDVPLELISGLKAGADHRVEGEELVVQIGGRVPGFERGVRLHPAGDDRVLLQLEERPLHVKQPFFVPCLGGDHRLFER